MNAANKKRRPIGLDELPAQLRRRHFYGLGFSREEVAKLVAAAVLVPIKRRASQRAFFDRDKSLEALGFFTR